MVYSDLARDSPVACVSISILYTQQFAVYDVLKKLLVLLLALSIWPWDTGIGTGAVVDDVEGLAPTGLLPRLRSLGSPTTPP